MRRSVSRSWIQAASRPPTRPRATSSSVIVTRHARLARALAGQARFMSGVARYEFAWDPSYRRLARLFGVTPARAWVELNDEWLVARFGVWSVRTSRANVLDATVTGPYAFLKTAGPPHLGVTDRSLSFASNSDGGVCVTFVRPVGGIEPTGRLTHPSLTLTVADLDGLTTALRQADRA